MQPDDVFHFGIFGLYINGHGHRSAGPVEGGGGGFQVGHEAVDAVFFRDEVVIAMLKTDILFNKEKGRHADGQTYHIKEGEGLVAPEIAEGNLEIVFEHGGRLLTGFRLKLMH